jgi:hypothetical protein
MEDTIGKNISRKENGGTPYCQDPGKQEKQTTRNTQADKAHEQPGYMTGRQKSLTGKSHRTGAQGRQNK